MEQRPRPGEDEEDLLKSQKEFLSQQTKPAATVSRKGDKRKSGETARDVVHMDTLPSSAPSMEPQPTKKSRFRTSREGRGQGHTELGATHSQGTCTQPALDPEEMLDKKDRGLATVLTSIIERDTSRRVFTAPHQSNLPFPLVVRQSESTAGKGEGQAKKSLFLQQIERQGVQEFGVMVQEEADKMDVSSGASGPSAGQQSFPHPIAVPAKSRIVDGRGLSASKPEEEAQGIHQENLVKMSEMAEEEILHEQQQLLKVLDPRIVAFLKSRAKAREEVGGKHEDEPERKETQKPKKKKQEPKDLPDTVASQKTGQWVHMDKVEYDKLQWLKDLPEPSASDPETGKQARFDFQGNLIPTTADVPVNLGLHHHGEEQERAGYSIGELFHLSRSTNIQQRVLAIVTLGHILRRAKEGCLEDAVQTPIIPSVVDGGVLFLLRWSCDDSVDAVIGAAVSTLCSLICNAADEAALDTVAPWYQGVATPSLVPAATVEVMQQNREEQDEDNKVKETDADVAKRDLIQALVSRMSLLDRFVYILDSRQPQAPVVVAILHILTRIARHSTQMSYEISRNKKLMDLIFKQLLPTSWESQEDQRSVSHVFGRPLAGAMRLVGALCQGGRHIAASLYSSYPLGNTLLRYLSVREEELGLSALEAEQLQKESLITWRILLHYGLAAEVYLDMYECLMGQMREVASRLSAESQGQPSAKEVYLVSVLEAVLPVAAAPAVKPGFNHSDGSEVEASPAGSGQWSCVQGVCPLVRLCVDHCLTYLAHHYPQQKPSLQFSTTCLNFLATYFTKQRGQSSGDPVDQLQQIEQLCTDSLLPFLKSQGFTSILSHLIASSNVVSTQGVQRREVSASLPEMGCDSREAQVPVVSGSSPVGFLLSLTRLIYVLGSSHRGVTEQMASLILTHSDVISYLRRLTSCPHGCLHGNHFTGFENLLHYFLIKLAVLAPPAEHRSLLHQLALDLIGRLQDGDEFLAHDLMSTVLFNADFIPEGSEEELAAAAMSEMKISDVHVLRSASQEVVTATNSHLLHEAYKSLAIIRGHYFRAFAHMEARVSMSRCVYLLLPQEVVCLLKGRCDDCLMPRDWLFLPLVELYNRSALHNQSTMPPSTVSMVTSVLQWIFLLEKWRSRSLASVSVTLKISRIMCVFLAGNDLFLERGVYPYLAQLFRCYTHPTLLDRVDFDEQVPGISSFYDLYMQFLDQYEAVSFGDAVFGAFVLLPMQQRQNCLLRQAVWQERTHLLRTLTLPVTEMLIDMERFLTPEEREPRLLQLYADSLLSGAVSQRWSPVLFLVAVHHLNRFLFYSTDRHNDPLRRRLFERILMSKDKALTELIIHFKQVNTEAQKCCEVYQPLPPNRAAVLAGYKQKLGLD